MKIDASKDFEAITKKVDSMKMAADLVEDEEVLKDIVLVFAQLIENMYLTIPNNKSEAHRLLTEQLYDTVLLEHGLHRITPKE